jgi:outer membrane lipoprotein SlyB
MTKLLTLFAIIAALAVTGCATQQQFLNNMQPTAMQTATSKGKFELNCPTAQPVLISREVVQPALQGPFVGGIQRAEFTVGVEGCGRRQTYIVVCPEGGDGCFATGPGRFHNWQTLGQ